MPSLLTVPREPLARFRLLALWFALFVALANGFALPFVDQGPRALIASVAALLLAAWWTYGYRRGGFPPSGWLADPILLIAATTAVPLPMAGLGLFYAGIQLRGLYISRPQLVVLIVGYDVARIASIALSPLDGMFGPASATLALQVIALAVIAVTLHAFVSAMERQATIEQALKRSDQRYRQLAAATRDVFYDWDIPSGTVEWSDTMLSVLGYTAADTQSSATWWLDCVHADDRAGLQDMVKAFVANPDQARDTYRYRVRRADGTFAYVVGNALAERGADGQPVRIMGAIRDVTVEEQLAEQLRQSQKMEAVGQLAGGVAHDFNNLLTVIGGHVYMLERKLPTSDVAERHLHGITHAADRAAQLTKQLLAFSRKQLLKPLVLSVNAVVDDVTQMIRPVIGEHVHVVTALDPLLAPVLADAGQLSQVLVNLALNARDAMPNGGTLTILTANVTLQPGSDEAIATNLPPGDYVRLTMRDTGVGMDAATLARAFEPFFTTKLPGSGTGLGLATVYGIVKQSLGDIRASSMPGRGAQFTLLLPAARRVEDAKPGGPTASADRPETESERHVLLVEDDDGVREFVYEVLAGAGYRVHQARNGADGLEVARSAIAAIDVVVTDVVMPRMGGREMVDHLRRERSDLRVLYMTGYTDDAHMLGELRGTDAQLLQKPFTACALTRALTRALTGVAVR